MTANQPDFYFVIMTGDNFPEKKAKRCKSHVICAFFRKVIHR